MPRKKPILITSNNEKQSLHMFKIFILRKATLVKPLLFIFLGFSDEEMPKIHGRHLSLSAPPGDKQSKGTVVLAQDPKSSQQHHMEKRQSCDHSISTRYPLVQESSCSASLICAGPQRNKSHYLNSDQSEAMCPARCKPVTYQ